MYQRILVAFDDSVVAAVALREALKLAGDSHAAVRVIHAVDVMLVTTAEVYMDLDMYRQDCLAAGQKVLDEAVAIAAAAGVAVESAVIEVEGGRFSNAIVEDARSWGADLIVLGTHARAGLAHFLMGSVAERVVRHSDVPVLLVRGHGAKP